MVSGRRLSAITGVRQSVRNSGRAFAFLVLFVLSSVQSAGGQSFDPKSLTGLYGAEPIDPALVAGSRALTVTRAYIPDAIDLSPLMPVPAQQQGGSCVAYSIAYAIRGYYAALENNVRPGDRNFTPSPAFVHSRIRHRRSGEACTQTGSHAFFAMRYFTSNGAPDRATIPDAEMCSQTVEYAEAAPDRFRIRGFHFIYVIERDRRRATNRDLDAIKQQLAAGHPVAVGFQLPGVPRGSPRDGALLQYLRAGEIYQGSAGPSGSTVGGHQMVFVGYDERRQAFLVQNSWGPYWSGNGFGWISYAAAKADMDNASVMRTSIVPPKPVPGITQSDHAVVDAEGDDCSHLRVVGEGGNGEPLLAGFVSSREALSRLDAAYSDRQLRDVAIRPWPVCEAMKTLAGPLAEPVRPEIRMLSGKSSLVYGDSLAFEVTAPDFASFLYIVYLQADGSVYNLSPRRGPIRYQAGIGQSFVFGDGRGGRQKFTVQPPSGAEAVIVIAARSPVSQLEDLEADSGQFVVPVSSASGNQTFDDRDFLTALRAGMAERPDKDSLGREISAALVHLTIQ